MCIMFGKRLKAIKDELVAKVNENAELSAKLANATKEVFDLEKKVKKSEKAIAEMEKELKARIKENHDLQFAVSSKDNTIKQLKAEKEKLKPKRDSKGKFVKK